MNVQVSGHIIMIIIVVVVVVVVVVVLSEKLSPSAIVHLLPIDTIFMMFLCMYVFEQFEHPYVNITEQK
jgi:hypothetical protein